MKIDIGFAKYCKNFIKTGTNIMKILKQTIFKILFLSIFLSTNVPSLFGMKNVGKNGTEIVEQNGIDFTQVLPSELRLKILSYLSSGKTSLKSALDILEEYSTINKSWRSLILDEIFQQKFFLEVLRQSDPQNFLSQVHNLIIKKKKPACINSKAFFFVATQAALNNVVKDWTCKSALNLLTSVVENINKIENEEFKYKILQLATETAKEKVESNISWFCEATLNLFVALVEKEYAPAYEAATEAAKKANVKSNGFVICRIASDLKKTLQKIKTIT